MTKPTDDSNDDLEGEQVRRSAGRILFADQIARDDANEAKAGLLSHEKFCTERWKNQTDAMARVEKAMGEIKTSVDDKIGKLPASIIAVLMGAVGFLAARVWH